MRRPVGVKSILVLLGEPSLFSPPSWPLSPCFHPHSRGAIRFRSVHVGRSRYSRFCHLFVALWFRSFRVEPWARPLTQSPELGFGFVFSLTGTILIFVLSFVLLGCRHFRFAAVGQRFVRFSA